MRTKDGDELLRASAFLHLFGLSTVQGLRERVRQGVFPRPDRPAQRNGEADLWWRSSVEDALRQYLDPINASKDAPNDQPSPLP